MAKKVKITAADFDLPEFEPELKNELYYAPDTFSSCLSTTTSYDPVYISGTTISYDPAYVRGTTITITNASATSTHTYVYADSAWFEVL